MGWTLFALQVLRNLAANFCAVFGLAPETEPAPAVSVEKASAKLCIRPATRPGKRVGGRLMGPVNGQTPGRGSNGGPTAEYRAVTPQKTREFIRERSPR